MTIIQVLVNKYKSIPDLDDKITYNIQAVLTYSNSTRNNSICMQPPRNSKIAPSKKDNKREAGKYLQNSETNV